MKKTILAIIVCWAFAAQQTSAQNFGQILGQLGEGLTLGAVVKNKKLQSADMKNYVAYVEQGNQYYNAAKYSEAMKSYQAAYQIVANTYDSNLKKLYTSYGWGKTLQENFNNAQTRYNAQHPEIQQQMTQCYSGGYNYTAPATSGTTTTATPKTTCRLCGGTGRQIKLFYSAGQTTMCYTCGKEVPTGHRHVICSLCYGSGVY